ncbi:MAG: hypothetical protein ACRBCI_01790 [Cellvibrionaceae bacterium]
MSIYPLKITAIIMLMANITLLNASELNTPHTFVAGEPAVAAEVNENFSAAQTAINDNHALIEATMDTVDDLSISTGVVAAGANSSISLNATDKTVRSITVIPPSDGRLVFVATAWFNCTSSTTCVPRCSINPGNSNIDTSRFSIGTVPNGGFQTLSIAGNLPVTTGTSLTLNMVCDTFAGSGSLGDANIIATFSTTDMTQ